MQNQEQFPNDDRRGGRMPKRVSGAHMYESEGKKPFPIWTIPAILTCLALLGVLGYALKAEFAQYEAYRAMMARVNVNTFYEGISVNGVDIGGLTMEEAGAKIGEGDTAAQSEFAVVIASGDKRWRISSAEVPLKFNTQDVLARAWALGRSGSLHERDALIARIKSEGVNLHTGMGYDREKVRELTDIVASRLSTPAVDAKLYAFEVATRAFTFTGESNGYQVDADKLYRDTIAALDAGNYDAVITPEGSVTQPTITKDALVSAFGLISSYTTETTKDKNRNTNIRLSAEAINGKVVMPGETLSFNACTGERTPEKGYREAGAIAGGVLALFVVIRLIMTKGAFLNSRKGHFVAICAALPVLLS